MHRQAKLRYASLWQKAARRRYKTFMIDEILSKETCDYFETFPMCPLPESLSARPKPLPPPLSFSTTRPYLPHPLIRPPPNLNHQLPQQSAPVGGLPSDLTLLSQQQPQAPEPSRSQAPLNARGESKTERSVPRPKKPYHSRIIFSKLQLMSLENKFEEQMYLSTQDSLVLAQALDLTQLQVKTWYRNRRIRLQKMMLKDGHEAPAISKGRPKKTSIPATKEMQPEEHMVKMGEERAWKEAEGPQVPGSEAHNPIRLMEESEKGVLFLMQSLKTHAAC